MCPWVNRYRAGDGVNDDLLLGVVTGNTVEVVSAIENGANVNAVDNFENYNWPIIYWAAQKRQPAVVPLLLKRGSDPNSRRVDEQETALHSAARFGDLGTVAALIKYGADINTHDRRNRTPLYWAAYYRRLVTVFLLVACGADITIKSSGGQAGNAEKIAAKRGFPEIARFLTEGCLDEKCLSLIKKYGFTGNMIEDKTNLDKIIEIHTVDTGAKPLRAADLYDDILQQKLWREREQLKYGKDWYTNPK